MPQISRPKGILTQKVDIYFMGFEVIRGWVFFCITSVPFLGNPNEKHFAEEGLDSAAKNKVGGEVS